MVKKLNYLALLTLLIFTSCKEEGAQKEEQENEATEVISEVKDEYAPDKRVALFDVEAIAHDEVYTLKGESNIPEAVNALKEKLESKSIKFTDSIQLLPAGLEGKNQGVIKISVANLRGNPTHSAELVTQATLGTPVNVLKKQDGWFLIQTPDGYIAWVDYGGIQNFSEEEFAEWKSAEKLIYLNPFGGSYESTSKDAQLVSDLVAGDILELVSDQIGFYEVKYPDGKKAYVAKADAFPYKKWVASLKESGEDLVKTSKQLMGLPYLWGGTSPKGVDCSGFTKTVYFLNGMVIPRDASQQIHTGTEVDSTKNFENLVAGDLLFFGRPATDSTSERVIHVGMWIGDNKFIHSMGNVHISTMDTTAADFDEYNYNRYLRSKRVLNTNDKGLIYLAKKDIFTSPVDTTKIKM
ncbi:C40 family peptidase [Gillisia sp. M10.2A]|uniref:C40 family peptidase n=1 Tax=Gillisia lutea TaxID=2909668 RepID=A0ABS9EGL9_9FLAO|nr:C40 family peptidase [Gillisia lutea]MCF4100606.1 C40 family peptidase [Gillisia lutea]